MGFLFLGWGWALVLLWWTGFMGKRAQRAQGTIILLDLGEMGGIVFSVGDLAFRGISGYGY